MLPTLIITVAVVALGSWMSDSVRVKQEETILHKLPVPEAHAFYERLRKRAARIRLLRAITLASLVVVIYIVRLRWFPMPPS